MTNQMLVDEMVSKTSQPSGAGKGVPKRVFQTLNDLIKRVFDVVASFIGLILLLPLFVVVSILIRRDSPGPIFYKGKRAAKGGGKFDIIKFRTMYERPASYEGSKVTARDDDRITPVGRWLRDTKINELPQLLNVLMGDMSLVGPRPEDPDIVATWQEASRREILSVRPGITSPASVIYRHEEKLLSSNDVMVTYIKSILPSKMRLDQLYVRNRSIWLDIDVIMWTVLVLLPRLETFQPPENYLFWGPIYQLFRRYINWFLVDTMIAIATFSITGFVWDQFLPNTATPVAAFLSSLAFALFFTVVGAILGINRIVWSKALFTDMVDLAPVAAAATIILLLGNNWLHVAPVGLLLISSGVSLMGFIAVRYRNRLLKILVSRLVTISPSVIGAREKVLIIGSGMGGQFAARMMNYRQGAGAYHTIGYIDDDYYKKGQRIQGILVLGNRQDIPRLVERYDVGIIIFAIHNIDPKDRQEILDTCYKTQATVYILPDFLGALNNVTSRGRDASKNMDQTAGDPYLKPVNLERGSDSLETKGVLETRQFIDLSERIFKQSIDANTPLILMAAEIDMNESVSNTLNGAMKEQLLWIVAAHCKSLLRDIDIVGIYDENKFMILAPQTKMAYVNIIINRLIKNTEQMVFKADFGELQVKLNLGVANREEDTTTLITLFNRAVADLILVKRSREVRDLDSVQLSQKPSE